MLQLSSEPPVPPAPVVLVPPVPPPVVVSVEVAPPALVSAPVVEEEVLVVVLLVVLTVLALELVVEPVLPVVPEVVVLGPLVAGFPLLPSEGSLHATPATPMMAKTETCIKLGTRRHKRMAER